MGDPNWFYSTLAQSSAAIVGLAGGFMISRVIAQRNKIDTDRAVFRANFVTFETQVNDRATVARGVRESIERALPDVTANMAVDTSLTWTFTHGLSSGTIELTPTDLERLTEAAADAGLYELALTFLAGDRRRLAKRMRAGEDLSNVGVPWMGEPMEGVIGGQADLVAALDQQRDWIRNDWVQISNEYNRVRGLALSLRRRIAVPSYVGLVLVLAGFLVGGIVVPLAFLSARPGASRLGLLGVFAGLGFLFLVYLSNEIRRLSQALDGDRDWY